MRLSPDNSPVFLTNIVVNLHGASASVQCIAAIAFGAGNPIIVPTFNVVIVRFKASAFEALEFVIAIVKSASRL